MAWPALSSVSALRYTVGMEHDHGDGARDHVDDILAQWARERPDLDAAPMGVVGRLSRLTR